MLSTEVQRSVRLNKKKKSTNISPYPDEAIERLARAFYPAIFACWNSEEGQREFAAWQEEQAHIATKEKQEVPDGELPALLVDFCRVRPGGRTLLLFWGALKQACCLRFAKFSNIISVYYSFKRCSKIDSLVAI